MKYKFIATHIIITGGILTMNSCELVTFISALACAISQNMSNQEIDLLAVVFTQLGDTLATISFKKSND